MGCGLGNHKLRDSACLAKHAVSDLWYLCGVLGFYLVRYYTIVVRYTAITAMHALLSNMQICGIVATA